MRSQLLALTAASAAAGCFSVDFPDGAIRCGEAGCPPGYQCAGDGTCRRSDGDGDGGIEPGVCDAMEMLADDFDGGTRLDGPCFGGLPLDGELRFTSSDSVSCSSLFYTLDGSSLSLEVVDIPSGTGVEVVLAAAIDQHNYGDPWLATSGAALLYRSGQLEARKQGVAVGSPVTYQPAAHRFWRLRGADQTIYWETSPDGSTWTPLHSEAAGFSLRYLQAQVGASGATCSAPVRVDNLNGGTPRGQACPIAELAEDFDSVRYDQVPSLLFVDAQDPNCASASTGTPTNVAWTVSSYGCSLESRSLYDLTGGGVSLEVVDRPDAIGRYVFLHAGGAAITLDAQAHLSAQQIGNLGEMDALDLADPSERFFRIREEDDEMIYEASADGGSWRAYASFPRQINARQLVVSFGTWNAGDPGDDTIVFDNLNILP